MYNISPTCDMLKILLVEGRSASCRKEQIRNLSIDFHHQSPMMKKIAELRDKYNLHMKVERYKSEDTIPATDQKYIRN